MNNGKLNVHLYEALKKSLYKPSAFFLGILFPLCEVSTLSARIASQDKLMSADCLLVERGRHRSFRLIKGFCSHAALGCRFGPSRPDGLHWSVQIACSRWPS
jgi:hypothetical protein